MKCKAIHKKLIFFLEGDLPGEEMQDIHTHLSGCTECAAFAEEIRKTMAVLKQDTPAQVTPYFYTRLKSRIDNQAEKESQGSGYSIGEKVLQPVLFTFLLLIGIYTGFRIGSNAVAEIQIPDNSQAEVVPYLNELKTEPLESFLME